MKFFSYLYTKTLSWSLHRHAPYYLAGVSFAESSFFPIPPDIMLISMGLAKPESSIRNALIATVFSVVGGIFGYLIGLFFMELIEPYILASSYASSFIKIQYWFDRYDVWMIILAGFTPLPYKLFTVTAGALKMAFLPFLLTSIIGRAMRFFLICGILYYFGEPIERRLRQFVDIVGWVMLLLVVGIFMCVKWIF